MQQTNNIEDLGSKVDGFVDCYVSTDDSEVAEILKKVGFREDIPCKTAKKREALEEIYGDCTVVSFFKQPKTGLEIYCIDIPLEDALKKRKEIGFMAMSRFRVHTNGCANITRILLPIINALNEEKQNMAIINDAGSKVYVRLSEFF